MSNHITYETILNRTLNRVQAGTDTSEGSFLFDAIAPCALELYEAYLYIEQLEKRVFADTAYHASEANGYSIGIETCHPDNGGEFTQSAYNSLIELLVDLCKRYKLEPTVGIIRHYDVTGKDCPRYYVRNQGEWVKFKEDVSRGM